MDLLVQHHPGLDDDAVAIVQPGDGDAAVDRLVLRTAIHHAGGKGADLGVALGVQRAGVVGGDEGGQQLVVGVEAELVAAGGAGQPLRGQPQRAVAGRGVAADIDLDEEGHDLPEREILRRQRADGIEVLRRIGRAVEHRIRHAVRRAARQRAVLGLPLRGRHRLVGRVVGAGALGRIGGVEVKAVGGGGVGEHRARRAALAFALNRGAGLQGGVGGVRRVHVPAGGDAAIGQAIRVAGAAIGHQPGLVRGAAVVAQRIVGGAVQAVGAGVGQQVDLEGKRRARGEAVSHQPGGAAGGEVVDRLPVRGASDDDLGGARHFRLFPR